MTGLYIYMVFMAGMEERWVAASMPIMTRAAEKFEMNWIASSIVRGKVTRVS